MTSAEFPEYIRCSKCGHEILNSLDNCPNCGNLVAENDIVGINEEENQRSENYPAPIPPDSEFRKSNNSHKLSNKKKIFFVSVLLCVLLIIIFSTVHLIKNYRINNLIIGDWKICAFYAKGKTYDDSALAWMGFSDRCASFSKNGKFDLEIPYADYSGKWKYDSSLKENDYGKKGYVYMLSSDEGNLCIAIKDVNEPDLLYIKCAVDEDESVMFVYKRYG